MTNSILWLILLFVPFYAWVNSEGNILEYFTHSVPQGQLLYVLSKLLGLYGLVFLWLHISITLLKKTPLRRFLTPWKVVDHRNSALFSFALVVTHLGLFVIAVSLRKEEVSFDLFGVNFSHGYYKSLLSLGALAFWLLIFVALIGWISSRVNSHHTTVSWLHRLSIVCFTLLYFHGLGIGSETKQGILLWFYLLIGMSLFIFTCLRLLTYFKLK